MSILSEIIKNNPPAVINASKNFRPKFNDELESVFFESTPKRELFNMLREAAELLVSLQIDGYQAGNDPAVWIWQAKNIGCSIPDWFIPEKSA